MLAGVDDGGVDVGVIFKLFVEGGRLHVVGAGADHDEDLLGGGHVLYIPYFGNWGQGEKERERKGDRYIWGLNVPVPYFFYRFSGMMFFITKVSDMFRLMSNAMCLPSGDQSEI